MLLSDDYFINVCMHLSLLKISFIVMNPEAINNACVETVMLYVSKDEQSRVFIRVKGS